MRSKGRAVPKRKKKALKTVKKATKSKKNRRKPKDAPRNTKNEDFSPNRFPYYPLVVVLLLVLGLYWISASVQKVRLEPRPDYSCPNCSVLLITLDTLRADHVGCYGYEYNTTPFIDELAGEGIVFEQAIASVPLTLPSHASILTSLYPFQHGVRDNGRYLVGESVVSVPELLRERGFTTAAFVSTFVLDSIFGLDQGFDVYDDELTYPKDKIWRAKWFNLTNISHYERKADEVSDAFLGWLSENQDTRFFVWLHYFDPHRSYRPPAEYKRIIGSKTRSYDGEIRFTDDQIRRVIGEMDDMGLLDDTIIVIVADHGEGLGDHGEKIHGNYLYDTTVWVPLILVNPRHEGGLRVSELVETIDIAPTILAILGYEKPDYLQGENLYDVMREGGKEVAYCETYYKTRSRRKRDEYWLCLRSEEFKYIYNNAGGDMLYNLTKDPGENKSLLRRGRNSTYYKKILDDFVKGASKHVHESRIMELDAESEEKLRSLGYLI